MTDADRPLTERLREWIIDPGVYLGESSRALMGETADALAAAVADNARLRAALRAIAENAEDWHGPPPDMGHVRALKVIATWARDALAESAGSPPPPEPEARLTYAAVGDINFPPEAQSGKERPTCACGHTTYWHSHGGVGDCEYSADCDCSKWRAP